MPTFLDATGLSKLLQKIKTVFATKTELASEVESLTTAANAYKTSVSNTYLKLSGGKMTGDLKVQTSTANQIRLVTGSYGVILRNDGSDFYILQTANGDAENGSWNDARPFTINFASGVGTVTRAIQDSDGRAINSSYLKLTGGNLTGRCIITGNNFGWQVTNGTRTIELMIGSGQVNRGIWDSKLGKWAVYANDSEVILNGRATGSGSDRRIKQDFSDIPDEVLDAWEQVKWTRFRLKKEAAKSDNAPLHVGAVVQDIQKAFEDKGIDSKEYAMLYHEPVPDEEGNRPSEDDPSLMNADKWYLKYEEALSIEAAYLRRCNERLSARLNEAIQRIEFLEEALRRQTNADIS